MPENGGQGVLRSARGVAAMDGKNSMISYSAIFSRLNGSCRMMLSISALLCLISMTASTLPSEDGGGRLHGGGCSGVDKATTTE